MRKPLLTSLFSLFFFITLLFLNSCKKDEEIEFEDVADAEAGDTTAWTKMDQDTLQDKIASFDVARGSTWKAWIKIHRECMKAEFFKKPTYMGVSNTSQLGTIYNEYNGLERRLTPAFTEEEIKSLIEEGSYQNCDFRQEVSTNVEVLLQSSVDVSSAGGDLEAELTVAIQNSKKTNMKLEKWRINKLDEGRLKDLLKDTQDAGKVNYKTAIKTKGNKFISTVAEIDGFVMRLEFESDMSAALVAKLQEGVIANIGESNFKASIRYINSKTIEMVSTNKAYVFVTLRKAKTINV